MSRPRKPWSSELPFADATRRDKDRYSSMQDELEKVTSRYSTSIVASEIHPEIIKYAESRPSNGYHGQVNRRVTWPREVLSVELAYHLPSCRLIRKPRLNKQRRVPRRRLYLTKPRPAGTGTCDGPASAFGSARLTSSDLDAAPSCCLCLGRSQGCILHHSRSFPKTMAAAAVGDNPFKDPTLASPAPLPDATQQPAVPDTLQVGRNASLTIADSLIVQGMHSVHSAASTTGMR